MASFFNLTLDTIAPKGLGVLLNDNAMYTTSTIVTLTVTLAEDEDATGYQMKVWGGNGVPDEETATWETFQTEKTITLTSGDGFKTVYVKARDAVGNETAPASDSITLNTVVPAVTVTGPDKSVISKVTGFDSSVISFVSDVEFIEYRVCVVPAENSLVAAGTVIPSAGGSVNTSGVQTEGTYPASETISVTIKGADLEAASAGDGVKKIKVFVRNVAGTWSVA